MLSFLFSLLFPIKSIGIQVKARNGRPNQVKWSASQEEIELNKIVVCFLIQEEVTTTQPEYHIISAGFIPTNQIKSSVSINDLYYFGGLRNYLEFLEQQEQFRRRNIARLANKVIKPLQAKSQLVPISAKPALNLDQIWQAVLGILQPPGTQAMFKQQGCLLVLEGTVARIGISSQSLFKMAQQRVTNLEDAFARHLGYSIRISLEVIVAPVSPKQTDDLPIADAAVAPEIPISVLVEEPIQRPSASLLPNNHADDWAIGDKVLHELFGEGEVTHIFGAGSKFCLAIKFPYIGRKIIDPKITLLEKCS